MVRKFGPICSWCPGNHVYNTQRLANLKKQIESNHLEFKEYISVCPAMLERTCLQVGYPGMICIRCINTGKYKRW